MLQALQQLQAHYEGALEGLRLACAQTQHADASVARWVRYCARLAGRTPSFAPLLLLARQLAHYLLATLSAQNSASFAVGTPACA